MELRDKIISQSETLFMRYGIKSVTMDDIARHIGVSKKTLYQFVENKADLIQQIFEVHIKEEKEALAVLSTDSKNALEEILGLAKMVIQELREMSPKVMYDLQKYYRESWQMMQSLHEGHIYQIIKANLERGMEEGLYRRDLNADIIAKLYVGKNSLVVDEDIFPLKYYKKENLYKQYIAYHIHGIASPKGLELLKEYETKEPETLGEE